MYPTIKDKIENIVPVSVCVDPSRGDGKATYGGYLKTEIEKISGASCNNGYEIDYVRLISVAEYWNLSPYYSGTDSNYPNISGITRLSTSSDYANWLYCKSSKCGGTAYSGYWWTMASYSGSSSINVRNACYVYSSGNLYVNNGGEPAFGVRPVITVRK